MVTVGVRYPMWFDFPQQPLKQLELTSLISKLTTLIRAAERAQQRLLFWLSKMQIFLAKYSYHPTVTVGLLNLFENREGVKIGKTKMKIG